jgi:sigma54-dependent transcription regulator
MANVIGQQSTWQPNLHRLAAQVDLIERFIEYGRAHKIRVDDDIQGNRKHAYNVRWMIESIDQRR